MLQAWFKALKAAPLPHVTASVFFAGAWAWIVACEYFLHRGQVVAATAMGVTAVCWVSGGVLSLADAFARYREYRRIKNLFARHGFDKRILRVVAGSRCQRDAAMLAATESGYRSLAAGYFFSLGYRWYHILPDKVLANPLHVLNPAFLRTTFVPGRKGL